MIHFLIVPLLGMLFIGCSLSHPPLQTVESVDLERYSGHWIELARYENRFEKGCVSATADYTITPEGVDVLNRCYDANALLIGEAKGKAHSVEESRNSRLKVTFFWPFYGDYWVLMLGENYQYSVIGDPRRNYLWILGRESKLSEIDRKTILEHLPALGYDPKRLYWTQPLK